jgi:NAD(P)H dehydrogenase (quinone)
MQSARGHSLSKINHVSKIAIIYHFLEEQTKRQAEAVFRGAQSVPSIQAWLHTTDEATTRLDELDGVDAIVLNCPTYGGIMCHGMKKFIETSAQKWATLAWKNKISGAFTNSSSFSGDKFNALVGLSVNAVQHGMIFVGLGMIPSTSKPNDPGEIVRPNPDACSRVDYSTGPMPVSFPVNPCDAPDRDNLETAEIYGRHIALITLQYNRRKNAQPHHAPHWSRDE